MPFVKLVTNLPDEKLPEDFHLALSAKIAKELNKPEEHVSVTVECDRRMSRSGTLDPLCELQCASVGLNTRDLTQPLAKAMTDFLHENTSIPTTRILFQFFDPMPHMVGLDGHVC